MIVATAGHIDHGKTALVKALTGIDADRLPEEKARGITVDLGFAYARPGGLSLGFVDVPGHERLVRTMVAGATGVDCALLVVAADDGVMPQTREHAAILDLLGLARGLVAITKSDRAGPERIAAVTEEVRALLAGTGLAGSPILPCSAATGDGIPDLIATLAGIGAGAPARKAAAGRGFRLAVDRGFTVPGAGLVVTGAVHAGTVRVGDRVIVSPSGIEARVRGLRAQSEVAEAGSTGERCALNLAGPRLSREAVHRGDWIVAPELHAPATRLDGEIRLLPGEARALRHRTPVQIHLGAASVTGRILLAPGAPALDPGGRAVARIALDAPIGALGGDRFILRDISASRTIGGGRVIDIDGPRRGAWLPARQAIVAALAEPEDGASLDALLALEESGLDPARFARLRNLPADTLDGLLAARDARIVEAPGGRRAFPASRIADLEGRLLALFDRRHAAEPDNPGLTPEEAAAALPAADGPLVRPVLDGLVRSGDLARRGATLHRPGHAARLHPADAALYAAIRATLDAAGRDPPRLALLAEALGRDPEGLRLLLDKVGRIGWLRRIPKGYYLPPGLLADLARLAAEVAHAHPDGLITVGRFREATGIGRHMTMPVLEYFDAVGFTARIAEGRRLRGDWRTLFGGDAP
ncbi:selenocysteine-specific translation elongation factor [Methylobacterium persicinum]|uniref:Selenocysteine-specific elongation factor n=1 Tax=Methylobacterium persicinum TaxID=374426 RepID=A0ABU0HLK8_9HYPH|nr:selenocysteine-specific translation elongation factor [Methylobacterium persicinum]MDQ0443207.1 selenocysteine-specific elongation factor [Methylobacterium persicinum]GJE38217.1 Selenocysteine-specific elongation factor [Methylobacterium persicinum]